MKFHLFRASRVMAILIFVVTVVAESRLSARQGCAEICWENSKFVSDCGSQVDCLCNDVEFQNTVHQCIYAQCHTAQYGLALYQALAACSSDQKSFDQIPQLFGHEYLKRRGNSHSGYVSGSASAFVSATRSSYARYGSASASMSARPTRSVIHGSGSGYFVKTYPSTGPLETPTPA